MNNLRQLCIETIDTFTYKQMTEQEKKYVDELKDEYDRIGEIRGNRITVGCLITFVLVLFLLTLIIIK